MSPGAEASAVRAIARCRGFNLLEKFDAVRGNRPFREEDFAIVREWGFDFVRLPLSYRCWTTTEDWRRLDELVLRQIDQAVAWGREYGVHVCLNLHRAPGYSVNRSVREPFNLWTDSEALEACCHQWVCFAARYLGVSPADLSFDLLNEPAQRAPDDPRIVDRVAYDRVLDAIVGAVRSVDPERPLWIEGGLWATLPLPWRRAPSTGQSLHVYTPFALTHWRSEFLQPALNGPPPTWPFDPDDARCAGTATRSKGIDAFYAGSVAPEVDRDGDGGVWDGPRLRRRLRSWAALSATGVPVHVGEFGVDRHTPHATTLAWMRDALAIFRRNAWGFALWQLRGRFGVLDSDRGDVRYESWRGHRLDRAMLESLREA